MKKNRFVYYILFLLFISCINNTFNVKRTCLVILEENKVDEKLGSGFKISKQIEEDKLTRKLLQKYLYKSLINTEWNEEFPNWVYTKSSFKKLILNIYTDTCFEKYSIYEYESRWTESYINLIYFCENSQVYYSLCDSLLSMNIDDGIIAMWDKDISKLKRVDAFEKLNNKNFDALALVYSVYCNSSIKKEEMRLEKKLSILDTQKFLELKKIKDENGNINFFDFMELIYGGM